MHDINESTLMEYINPCSDQARHALFQTYLNDRDSHNIYLKIKLN